MKKELCLVGVSLSFILIIVLASFVYADTACANDQVIMRLYQGNNSHGALWDGSFIAQCSGLPTVVCSDYNNDGPGCMINGCKFNPAKCIVNPGETCDCNKFLVGGSQNTPPCQTNPNIGCVPSGNFCGNPIGTGKCECTGITSTNIISNLPPYTRIWTVQEICEYSPVSHNCIWQASSCTENPVCENYNDDEVGCENIGCNYDLIPAYSVPICYSDIFGVPYTGYSEASPHDCTGFNRVISLYSVNNSHASVKHDSNYNVDVCYGDLICESKTEPALCPPGYNVTLRLYQATNSHISNASDITYPIKICCKSRNAYIDGVYWRDMKGSSTITGADLNDTVKMFVSGGNLQGLDIKYNITKLIEGKWVQFKSFKESATLPDSDSAIWKADVSGTYNVSSSVDGINWKFSGQLSVNNKEDNSAPLTGIMFPADKQIYFLGENISFWQSSSDKDDILAYTWNFGDGTVLSGNNLNMNNYNFGWVFDSPGQKNIVLNVTDGRGLSARTQVSILVISSGQYVLAYIDNPKWGSFFNTRGVDFDASSSYAIRSTGLNYPEVPFTIRCLAGNCPANTRGLLPGKGIGTGIQIPVEGSPTTANPANYMDLKFTWEFLDEGTNRTGTGNDVKIFKKIYRVARNHRTRLSVEYSQETMGTL